MLSTWLPLILVVLAGSPASTSIVTVSPAQLDTNSSPDVYYTVHNPGPGLLFNVTMTLPAALRPVGFFESSGRWAPTARAIPGGYSISWFGGPIQPGNAADFGLALLAPPRPGSFTSSVLLVYSANQTTASSVVLTVDCPCLLGIDMRYFAYWLIVGVLVLPLLELAVLRLQKPAPGDNLHEHGRNK